MKRLAAIHGVPATYVNTAPVDSLPVSIAILGCDLSRGVAANDVVAGGFTSSPPGPWTSIKLFFGDGSAELYLNINVKDSIAEFAVKDEANGPDLLPFLGSVIEAP